MSFYPAPSVDPRRQLEQMALAMGRQVNYHCWDSGSPNRPIWNCRVFYEALTISGQLTSIVVAQVQNHRQMKDACVEAALEAIRVLAAEASQQYTTMYATI